MKAILPGNNVQTCVIVSIPQSTIDGLTHNISISRAYAKCAFLAAAHQQIRRPPLECQALQGVADLEA
jgi:hypothetical protein